MSGALPTSLWLESEMRRLQGAGSYLTLLKRGNSASGTVLAILRNRIGEHRLFSQITDMDSGNRVWFPAFDGACVDSDKADAYSRDALRFDPDLWVIEIETEADIPPLQDNY